MEIAHIIPHVEALIFSSDRPLPALEIVELLNNAQGFLEDRATLEQVEAAIEATVEKYNSEFYAFEIRQSGGGYQFLTKPTYYSTVAQLNGDKYLKKLSTAALETLAIIAYKQPVTKGDIETIRGVNSDYSIQKLLEKELIIISGRSEQMVGKPLLYNTSRSFMDYFGLNSPEDLPKIKEIIQEQLVDATRMDNRDQLMERGDQETEVESEDGEDLHLVVTETGELLMNSPEEQLNETAELLDETILSDGADDKEETEKIADSPDHEANMEVELLSDEGGLDEEMKETGANELDAATGEDEGEYEEEEEGTDEGVEEDEDNADDDEYEGDEEKDEAEDEDEEDEEEDEDEDDEDDEDEDDEEDEDEEEDEDKGDDEKEANGEQRNDADDGPDEDNDEEKQR